MYGGRREGSIIYEQCVGVKSIDEHRRSYETEDDALFDCVGIIEKLDGLILLWGRKEGLGE